MLERGEDVVLIDEGHLDVELRELRLAICAQVLVAHAVSQLKVPVEAGDHGKLLVQLGGLGQRIEAAGEQPARDEVVARSFGRGPDHHRSLDLEESDLVHGATELGAEFRASPDVALQVNAA